MKIAYLAYSAIPSRMANSIHVMKMCCAFGKLGHDVRLYVPNRVKECEPSIKNVYDFYGVEPTFEIERLPWPGIKLRSIVYTGMLLRGILAWNPDGIYSRYLPGSVAVGLRGRRSIFETHAPVWKEGRVQETSLRMLVRSGRVPAIVSISSSLKKAYQSRGINPNEGIVLAPDAADDPMGQVQKRSPVYGKRLQIGYVGQLYPGKGMEVVAAIAPRLPECDFHIVGGYPSDINAWKNRIDSANVCFHGFVPPVEVSLRIAALDVCLLPNQRSVQAHSAGKRHTVNIADYTSPLKMFEYMAHGKAIVCSRIPVLQEILDESVAILANPEDPEEWVAAVKKLESPELRDSLGNAARLAFLARHTWESRALMLVDVLKKCGR